MIERTAALLNKWRKYADSKQQRMLMPGAHGLAPPVVVATLIFSWCVVEICEELSRLTLDNIGVMAFGQHFNAIEDSSQTHTGTSHTPFFFFFFFSISQSTQTIRSTRMCPSS
jgi:hypothetical protein